MQRKVEVMKTRQSSMIKEVKSNNNKNTGSYKNEYKLT
jgi:hypothetical protein